MSLQCSLKYKRQFYFLFSLCIQYFLTSYCHKDVNNNFLKLATEENVKHNEVTEYIYGYPHIIKVDNSFAVNSHGKIKIVNGKVVFSDANGNKIPLSILDY